jgi:2-phosphosulfolactate phosphatase
LNDTSLEILFSPAEFATLEARDLSDTVCVVIDVLRATSSMTTALANGAAAIIPVAEISEALDLRRKYPHILLAGEREGVRILRHLTGGIDFDLGNSPREFRRQTVNGRTVAMTTTNGTRALRACARAWTVLVGSFLNLQATSELLLREPPKHLLLVCSGTFDQSAYEDILCAGALFQLLQPIYGKGVISDSAEIARRLYILDQEDLIGAMAWSRNARRLLANAELADDVAFCLKRDQFPLVAELAPDGMIRRRNANQTETPYG